MLSELSVDLLTEICQYSGINEVLSLKLCSKALYEKLTCENSWRIWSSLFVSKKDALELGINHMWWIFNLNRAKSKNWKITSKVSFIRSLKGVGPCCVSLYISPLETIKTTQKRLASEYGNACMRRLASTTRTLGAITTAQQSLKLYNEVPKNGLVIFCGYVLTDARKERKVHFEIEPCFPVHNYSFLIERKFDTKSLEDMMKPLIGVVTIENDKEKLEVRNQFEIENIITQNIHSYIEQNFLNWKGLIFQSTDKIKLDHFKKSLSANILESTIIELVAPIESKILDTFMDKLYQIPLEESETMIRDTITLHWLLRNPKIKKWNPKQLFKNDISHSKYFLCDNLTTSYFVLNVRDEESEELNSSNLRSEILSCESILEWAVRMFPNQVVILCKGAYDALEVSCEQIFSLE